MIYYAIRIAIPSQVREAAKRDISWPLAPTLKKFRISLEARVWDLGLGVQNLGLGNALTHVTVGCYLQYNYIILYDPALIYKV